MLQSSPPPVTHRGERPRRAGPEAADRHDPEHADGLHGVAERRATGRAAGHGRGRCAWAQRVKCSRIAPALAAKRRSQPRTVEAGRPRSAAIRRWPWPRALADQGGADDLDAVAAAQQGVLGDQHVGGGAGPADRAPEAAPLGPLGQAHLTLDAVAPGPKARLTVRAAKTALDQVRLDGGLVSPYDEHSGAPASSGRAPSRSVERFWRGGSCAFRSCSR